MRLPPAVPFCLAGAHTEGLAPPQSGPARSPAVVAERASSERNSQLRGRHGEGPEFGGGDLLGGPVRRSDRLGSGSGRRAQYAFEDRTDPGFAGHQGASHDGAVHRLAARRHNVLRGTQDGPRANVKLSRAEEQVHAEGSGTGLIDAVCHSISQATGVAARVVAFRAYSVGPGSEAVGEVELEVELPGRRVAVRASSTDVVEAAGLALVAALNQYNAKRQAQG